MKRLRISGGGLSAAGGAWGVGFGTLLVLATWTGHLRAQDTRQPAPAVVGMPAVVAGTTAAQDPLAAVAFMTGCWAEDTPGSGLREYYTPPAPNMMTGLSRFLRDGRVVDWEFHRIDAGPAGPTLTPHPRGVTSVTFSPASIGENRIVWENLEHDFPQRIIYERTGPEELVVRIEGGKGAEARSIAWRMRRVSCTEPG